MTSGDHAGAAPSRAPDWSRRDTRILTALLLGCLSVRLLVAGRRTVIFNDGPRFIEMARHFSAGDWAAAVSDAYHPLYSLLVAGVHRGLAAVGAIEGSEAAHVGSNGSWELAAVATSVVCGSLAVVPLYSFLRSSFGVDAACVGGALYAAHPYASQFAADVQSEGLYLLVFLTGVACLWRAARERSASWAAAAGVAASLAYLTRPEGLGVALVGLALGGFVGRSGSWSAAERLRWLAALLLAAGLVAAPYLGSLRAVSGEWSLTQKKSVAQLATGAEAPVPAEARDWQSAGSRLSVPPLELACTRGLQPPMTESREVGIHAQPSDPPSAARRAAASVLALLRNAIGSLRPEILVLLALGLWRERGRPGSRGGFIFAFLGLYAAVLFALSFNVGYVSRRHSLPVLLLLLGHAALGATWLAEGVRRKVRVSGATGLAAITALCVLIALPKTLAEHRAERLAVRRAAEWLRDHPEVPGAVAGEAARVGFYAERPLVPLAPWGHSQSPAELARAGARVVVADASALGDLDALLADCADEVHLLYRVEAEGRRAYVLGLGPSTSP